MVRRSLGAVKEPIRRLCVDDEGATMIEYALVVGLIAAVCAGAVGLLGGKTAGLFDQAKFP